jgi:hypothetical protein
MPLGRNGNKAPVVSSGGGINSLLDGMLEHMLGFLETWEAVRMCVLARRPTLALPLEVRHGIGYRVYHQ